MSLEKTRSIEHVKQPEEFEFEMAVRPLMKYLAQNHHPHTKVIVESNSAELMEGLSSVVTDEYLTD